MPIYEYVCKACGHKFEKLASLASAHLTNECPKCGATSGERVMSKTNSAGTNSTGAARGYCGPMSFG
ncbi:MAG: zinc ribbon domain-containing protein [Nitrospinae bacterium]|nr:zinc ribbon domain-containing protein [Nitrospinota bacterium]